MLQDGGEQRLIRKGMENIILVFAFAYFPPTHLPDGSE
jgi:hypothetical protein